MKLGETYARADVRSLYLHIQSCEVGCLRKKCKRMKKLSIELSSLRNWFGLKLVSCNRKDFNSTVQYVGLKL